MRSALVLAAAVVVLAGCGGGSSADTDVVELDANDPRIAAARDKAQQRWDEFARSFRAARPDVDYAVKVALPTADGSSEHIWVAVTAIDGQTIAGTIANDPVGDIGLSYGDAVTVKRREVEDWLISRGEKTLGGGFSVAAAEAAR